MHEHLEIALFFENYWFFTPVQSLKVDKNLEVLTVNSRLKYITLFLRFVLLCCIACLTILEIVYTDTEESCKIVFVTDVAYHCGEEIVFIIMYLKDILMDYRRLNILNVANEILEGNQIQIPNRKAQYLNKNVLLVVFCCILCVCRQILHAIVGIRNIYDGLIIAFLIKRIYCSTYIQIAIILWIVHITAIIEIQINIYSKATDTKNIELIQVNEIKQQLTAISRQHKNVLHLAGLLNGYFSLDILLIVISKYLSLLLDLFGIYLFLYTSEDEVFKLEIILNVFYNTIQLFLVIVPCTCLNTNIDKLCDVFHADDILLGQRYADIKQIVTKTDCFVFHIIYAYVFL